MGNSRKMQHGISGTSQCHINGQRIQNRILCDNISCPDILTEHFHNSHARMLCKLNSLGINCRNGSVSLKSHTKSFCQTVHGIGRIHTGTGTAGRTYLILKLCHILLGVSTCCVRAYCLKHGRKTSLLSLHMAGKHRTAGYKNGRKIESCCCHQKPRYVLVTVWNHNQRVKLMGDCHTLGGICNQISGYQGIFHADMSHGNSVTDCDCRKYHRHTAGLCNSKFHSLYNFIQIHMARNNLIVGTYDSHHRLFHFFRGKSQGIEQASRRSLLHAASCVITRHICTPFFLTHFLNLLVTIRETLRIVVYFS